MKVKKLIEELQKFNPELDVFLDGTLKLFHIGCIKKIKVYKDKETLFMIDENHQHYPVLYDRYNKAAMNTKNPQAIMISWMGDYKNKK